MKTKEILKSIREGARCIVTGKRDPDPHHVKTRGSGGSEELWNLMPLSREMHMEVHTMGLRRFADKHTAVRQWLILHGWTLDPIILKWVHEEKTAMDPSPSP